MAGNANDFDFAASSISAYFSGVAIGMARSPTSPRCHELAGPRCPSAGPGSNTSRRSRSGRGPIVGGSCWPTSQPEPRRPAPIPPPGATCLLTHRDPTGRRPARRRRWCSSPMLALALVLEWLRRRRREAKKKPERASPAAVRGRPSARAARAGGRPRLRRPEGGRVPPDDPRAVASPPWRRSRSVSCASRRTPASSPTWAIVPASPSPPRPRSAKRQALGKRALRAGLPTRAPAARCADRAISILTWTLFTPARTARARGALGALRRDRAQRRRSWSALPTATPLLGRACPSRCASCQTTTGADVSCAQAARLQAGSGLSSRHAGRGPRPAYPDAQAYTADRPRPLQAADGQTAATGSRRAERRLERRRPLHPLPRPGSLSAHGTSESALRSTAPVERVLASCSATSTDGRSGPSRSPVPGGIDEGPLQPGSPTPSLSQPRIPKRRVDRHGGGSWTFVELGRRPAPGVRTDGPPPTRAAARRAHARATRGRAGGLAGQGRRAAVRAADRPLPGDGVSGTQDHEPSAPRG